MALKIPNVYPVLFSDPTEFRPRLILAEDDDEIRAALELLFLRDGFDVASARDGYELVDLLEQARDEEQLPYVIITDHRMPGYTGMEVVEALRDNGWPVPVIVITAYGRDVEDASLEDGPDAIFRKPFDADDLRTAVLYCLHDRGVSANDESP